MGTKKILLISTGGTIAGNVAEINGEQKAHATAEDYDKKIKHTKVNIKKKWNIDLKIIPQSLTSPTGEVVDVDSSNIEPSHWKNLASKIEMEYDNFDAFIITHGTNTLGYTSAALSYSFVNINKPVIVTGSQVPFGHSGSDALMNLDNSVRVAVWPYNNIKGVIVVFGSSIISGVNAKKSTEFNYDAFKSYSSGNLGEVGRIIHFHENSLQTHNNYYNKSDLNIALTSANLIVKKDFDTNIASISEFPGMNPKMLLDLVNKTKVKGIILRAFGAGDPSTRFLDVFKTLKEKKIPVIITTQAPNGNSNFQVNESGQLLKQKDLAIPAYNMSIESQVTKLSWLLGQKYSYENIINMFSKDLKGEITIMKERIQ